MTINHVSIGWQKYDILVQKRVKFLGVSSIVSLTSATKDAADRRYCSQVVNQIRYCSRIYGNEV